MKLIPVFVLSLLLISPSFGQKDQTEKKLVKWVDDHNEEAMVLLKDLVNIKIRPKLKKKMVSKHCGTLKKVQSLHCSPVILWK